jgi:N4-gp56 family major capsid protein
MTVNNFIPVVWSAKLLESLKKAHVYTQTGVVNTDYIGDIAGMGSQVKINAIGDVTIKPYTKNVPIDAPDVLSDAQTTLDIDQADYFNFAVDDVDVAQQVPKIMTAAMAQASYNLSDVSDSYVADLMVAGVAGGNKIGTSASAIVPDPDNSGETAYDYIVDMSTALSDAGCPKQGRWIIVPPWFTGELVKDDRFTNMAASGSPEALRNGFVSRVAGFDVLESLNVPDVTGTGGETGKTDSAIVAGHPMAFSYAEQINKVEAYRPPDSFSDAVKGLHLYGGKVVRPTCLALLTARAVD